MRWAIAIAALRGVRRLAPEQVRPELRRAIEELRAAAVDAAERRRARRTLHGARGVRLNLGSGGRARPGWMNLDLDRGGELRLDLRRPLPLPDASCAEIYSEHVLEHLAYPGEVEAVLRTGSACSRREACSRSASRTPSGPSSRT